MVEMQSEDTRNTGALYDCPDFGTAVCDTCKDAAECGRLRDIFNGQAGEVVTLEV